MTTGTQQPAAPLPQLAAAPAPIIFLDTNAVHYAALALSFGSKYALDIVAQPTANLKAKLQANGITAWERYVNGARIVRYLCRRFQDAAAEIYYSPMTGLELLCGGLRGQAVKRAAQVGVPHRWFSRMDEKEIRTCLEPDGYTQVKGLQANIDVLLDGVGLTVTEKQIDSDVWELARALMENVFVDVQDCLVYASAIITQANELITADGYLHGTVCCAHNPGGATPDLIARFTTLRDAIVQSCVTILGWDPADAAKVIIPVSVGNTDIRNFLNEGNA